MQRKGDFQMSLGFIIAVVFAIVLLTLAITWLRGIIGQVGTLTDDLTQQAHSTLQEAFSQTTTNFAIYPRQYNLDSGKALILSAGIKNDGADGQDHRFVINVIPSEASANVRASPTYVCQQSFALAQCTTLYTEMQSWITFDSSSGLIKINSFDFKRIQISPSTSAVKGTYIFKVIACYNGENENPNTAPPASCTEATPSNRRWGNSQDLVVTIK